MEIKATITAQADTAPYRTILASASNTIYADEPLEKGGGNTGLDPHELMAASLAACTSITMRMFAERKAWNIDGLQVQVQIEREDNASGTTTVFQRQINLPATLDATQREHLLHVANSCPIHKLLHGTITINTSLRDESSH